MVRRIPIALPASCRLRPSIERAILHLTSGADTKAAKFFINCLAEQPEDVAKFLVPRIRQVCSSLLMPHSVK